MGKAEWGADPEFFGPRHAHREGRIVGTLRRFAPASGPHLECAAGVGSLSFSLARRGRGVVAADRSLRSLAELDRRARQAGLRERVLPVVADITMLPFDDESFASATSAETLEHLPDDAAAAGELARVLRRGGWLVGTVPANPRQWSDWDDWGGHLRRYTVSGMRELLGGAGLDARVMVWGWPFQRLYDELFLTRVNRRRLHTDGPLDQDPELRRVARLGRSRWLVGVVRVVLELDRLFDGLPWGVGLIYAAQKPPEALVARPARAVDRTAPAPTCP
jgi:SAM-dependent methyltransferase